jgi:hypothetical protein
MKDLPFRSVLAWTVALALAWGGAACTANTAPEPGVDLEVEVSGTPVLRTVEPGLVFGANLGAWVASEKLDAGTRNLLRALRPSVARFPGGNISNNYCWTQQKVSGNDHLVWEDWSWGTDVDDYIAFLKAAGCTPMFTLNPFDHAIDGETHLAADEAGALAANLAAEGLAGGFFEVGNENDGSWNPMLTIPEYTDRFVLLAEAVKAADPAARLLGPVMDYARLGEFLDRLDLAGGTGLLDFVSYHRYGGWISNGNTAGIDLDDPQAYGDGLEALRAALDARGLQRIKIAVTEINAAIWDTGCTRDQFTIKQAIWLADALGVSLVHADAANVWIHLHPGTDPHSLIDSDVTPPAPTKNYWPVYLAAQTLAGADPAAPVEVLTVRFGAGAAGLAGYAARKADGSVGVILVNKSDTGIDVSLTPPAAPRAVTGRLLDAAAYGAGTGPVALAVRLESGRALFTLPGLSIAGFDLR